MRPGKALLTVHWKRGEITELLLELWKRRHGYDPIRCEQERAKCCRLILVGTISIAVCLAAGTILGHRMIFGGLALLLTLATIPYCFWKIVPAETGDDFYIRLKEVLAIWEVNLWEVAQFDLDQLVAQAERRLMKQFVSMVASKKRVDAAGLNSYGKKLRRFTARSRRVEKHYHALYELGWIQKNYSYYYAEAERRLELDRALTIVG